ncbi:MAG: hotdog domain-containing protein [Myxococcota bacterium]|nr:hotdog domain-containing protein [Myxococcota bacterium]
MLRANPHGMIDELSLSIPRHALNPRHAVRAGEVWRLLQSAAVAASSRHGWPPERYRTSGTGFIVAHMVVVHHRELRDGETPTATTWVRDFRRGMLSRREIRLHCAGVPVVATSQQWVHVSAAAMAPARASAEMLAAFQPVTVDHEPVVMPAVTKGTGPSWRLEFRCWHSWMDVLSHVNHPTYVDWCDEAILQRLATLGADPTLLVPVAEEIRFRRGVLAGQDVVVESHLSGTADGDAVCTHTITADGVIAATATTVRRLTEGSLAALLA